MATAEDMRALFLDEQAQLQHAAQRRRLIDAQLHAKARDVYAAEHTLAHVHTLPTHTHTYLAVGRMFLHQPQSVLAEGLKVKLVQAREAVAQLESGRAAVDRAIRDKEHAMQELLVAKARMG